jgi:cysteine synthase B
MEHARDFAERMRDEGKGIILDQVRKPGPIRSRTIAGRGPRSGATRAGTITHFVSAMGTTGTIHGRLAVP